MLEEVLLAGERSRELDDDVLGRGVSGHVARVSGSTKTCEHLVHKSSGFLSTRLEADAARERIGCILDISKLLFSPKRTYKT